MAIAMCARVKAMTKFDFHTSDCCRDGTAHVLFNATTVIVSCCNCLATSSISYS